MIKLKKSKPYMAKSSGVGIQVIESERVKANNQAGKVKPIYGEIISGPGEENK